MAAMGSGGHLYCIWVNLCLFNVCGWCSGPCFPTHSHFLLLRANGWLQLSEDDGKEERKKARAAKAGGSSD